jgi:hypothetical protein
VSNPVVIENAQAGTADWLLDRPATQREIEGYASATSVERGGTIALYVNTRALTFTLEVFRIGGYQGLGARRVFAESGSADRIMACHKKGRRDPLFETDRSRVTDKWCSAEVDRPEERLIGVMCAGDPVDGDIVSADASHWVFDGTGLANGARLRGLLGYEVDAVQGRGLNSVEIIATSPWTAMNDADRSGVVHMTLYTASSGALVFATGSIQWAWGLDDFNVPALRSSRLCAAAQQVTRNVLARSKAPLRQ